MPRRSCRQLVEGKHRVRRIIGITGLAVLWLSACQGAAPRRQITAGEELAAYNFSVPGSFEEGGYGGATLRVNDGVYRIDVLQGDNTLWWGQWGDTYSDVVLEVDIEQISERNENAYGVMCRVRGSVGQDREVDPELAAIMEETSEPSDELATPEADATDVPDEEATEVSEDEETDATDVPDEEATEVSEDEETDATEAPVDESSEEEAQATESPDAEATEAPTDEPSFGDGDGYLFLIQGTGSFSILRARGRNVVPLVDWTVSDAIEVGPASNHIRAICAGDYLAMYVNDRFVGDATDDSYSSGQVGLVASAANVLGVRVQFDNFIVSEAQTG